MKFPLTIAPLSQDMAGNFLIHTPNEIRQILRGIENTGAAVALYFDEGNDFITTTMLGVSDQGVWVDVGVKSRGNPRLLNSREIILVSSHQQVKVQFASHRIKNMLFGNREAYWLPLPDSLLRIQQRDFYRLPAKPLTCILPSLPGTQSTQRELAITDISEGGVSLVCDAHETDWQAGKIFQNCRIALPEIGILLATLKVKSVQHISLHQGEISKRAGCEFLHLSNKLAFLLQRHLARMQRQNLAQR